MEGEIVVAGPGQMVEFTLGACKGEELLGAGTQVIFCVVTVVKDRMVVGVDGKLGRVGKDHL
jgi:hypothetical protein